MATKDKTEFESIKQGLEDFAKQEGRRFAFSIIPVSCMNDMFKAARAGDEEARAALIAFGNWCSSVEKEKAKGGKPACVGCLKELKPVNDGGNGIGGWAQIIPVKSGGVGVVAPICIECIKRDHDELSTKVLDAMDEEVGVRAMTVQ